MNKLLAQVSIGNETILRPGKSISSVYGNLGVLVSVFIKNAYVLAGILLFLLLIFGGLGLIMSAGSGDAKKTAQGQQAITTALIGFLIIFASYWIIQIIETVTGLNILNPQ